jgi:hypothetical protein
MWEHKNHQCHHKSPLLNLFLTIRLIKICFNIIIVTFLHLGLNVAFILVPQCYICSPLRAMYPESSHCFFEGGPRWNCSLFPSSILMMTFRRLFPRWSLPAGGRTRHLLASQCGNNSSRLQGFSSAPPGEGSNLLWRHEMKGLNIKVILKTRAINCTFCRLTWKTTQDKKSQIRC